VKISQKTRRVLRNLVASRHREAARRCAITARAFGRIADEQTDEEERRFCGLAQRAALCLREWHDIFCELIESADRDPEFREALQAILAPVAPEPLPLFNFPGSAEAKGKETTNADEIED